MLAAFGWLMALASLAGGGWFAWKRSVEHERVRQEINKELLAKAKEAKDREAKILAKPNDPKRTVIERMRRNRDKG